MTATPDLDDLARRREEAQAAADAAAEELAVAEAERDAERNRRREEWDFGIVAEHADRVRALEREERELRATFYDVAMADPMVRAWIEFRAVRWRRMALDSQVANALVRVGREAESMRVSTATPGWVEPTLWADVVAAADDLAQERGADDAAAFDEHREKITRGDLP